MATTEFRETLDALGLAQHRVAQLFAVAPRSVRRWQDGDRRVPCGVNIVLRLLAVGAVTVAQVEQAVAPVPARTNGNAKPEPLLVEPAPEPSVVADVKTAAFADPTSADLTSADPTFADLTFADPGPSTAEKVVVLTPDACRWPYGDPVHSDFRFCGDLVDRKPYCKQHRAMAYVTLPTGGRRGATAPSRRSLLRYRGR